MDTMKKITFKSGGFSLTGNLFYPETYQEGKKLPAIVCSAPASGVKEQVVGFYAEKLSKHGFITLAFDYTGYGESEGGNTFYENPYIKMEDIKNAISYLRTLSEVDKNNVFNFGVCMGSAYSVYATATDGRVKAVATASPIFNVKETQLMIYGGNVAVRDVLKNASEARQKYYETGEETHFAPLPDDSDALPEQMREMIQYYTIGAGNCPTWRNKTLAWSTETMLAFSVEQCTDLLEAVPVFMIYGDQAYTANNNEEIYNAIEGDKDRFVVEGATHFDYYYKEEYVNPAVEKIAAFYKKYI